MAVPRDPQIIDDPEQRPVLVHCARGTCRTGAAVAIYRFERRRLDNRRRRDRDARQTYRYGWLPGYMYAMAKNKPSSCLGRARNDVRPQPSSWAAHSFAVETTKASLEQTAQHEPSRPTSPLTGTLVREHADVARGGGE